MSWGQASSTDLLYWQRETTILTSPRPSYETAGAWSGNAVIGGLLAYSCTRWSNSKGIDSSLCLASTDGIRSKKNPVLQTPAQATGGWRDPAPFQEGNSTFLAFGASLGPRRGAVLLTSFPQVKHIVQPLFTVPRIRGAPDMIECPDVAWLDENVVVLKLSIMANRSQRHDLFILGLLERNTENSPVFTPLNKSRNLPRCGGIRPDWEVAVGALRLDCGDLYASQSFKLMPNQQLIYMGWIKDQDTNELYNGALSFPRHLFFQDDRLFYSFLPNLSKLRTDERLASLHRSTTADESLLVISELPSSRRLEIAIYDFRFRRQGTPSHFVLDLPGRRIEATLNFDVNAAVISVYDACEMRVVFTNDNDQNLTIRILIDGSLVEWDIGDGLSACSHRSYRTLINKNSTPAARLSSSSSSLRNIKMCAWRLSA
uniref:beta-fructofuranosidase n=1 Tax=Aureoumbra lagunensis TaxID=44058 RepID=A0A7S3JZ86_9STRA|mmetsp:Transcript_10505/g.13147  ORF Transcript_10505/g.13147 Transcript_10505/m.13147 type:complete len:429 (+) Transcript_10505:238-1524(+)